MGRPKMHNIFILASPMLIIFSANLSRNKFNYSYPEKINNKHLDKVIFLYQELFVIYKVL